LNISAGVILRPSRRLATIARYGSSGEFTNVASSSVKPSRGNVTTSLGRPSNAAAAGTPDAKPSCVNSTASLGASARATAGTGVAGANGRSEADATVDDSSEVADATAADARTGGVDSAASPDSLPPLAALRFPLRSFLFQPPSFVR